LPKIEDGKSWLTRPKLYKGFVEPYKKNPSSIDKTILLPVWQSAEQDADKKN
jgi:hypothetical protein